MKNLHLFSIKDKINIVNKETFNEKDTIYKCFFICNDKIIIFDYEKFYLTTNDLKKFNIKREDTFYINSNKNILGFSVTVNKLKKILSSTKFSFIKLREAINVANKDLIPYLSALHSLKKWKENNKFCSKCGHKNVSLNLDNSLICKNINCRKRTFPRIDPTVIILIKNNDKILLARNKEWKENLYSCIAGFCELNESLEETVYRETLEEVGIRVKNINYLFSQFWPFSNNLMVGFEASAPSYKLKLDNYEIEDAIWVSKKELIKLNKLEKIILPRNYAIAYSLINYWLKS